MSCAVSGGRAPAADRASAEAEVGVCPGAWRAQLTHHPAQPTALGAPAVSLLEGVSVTHRRDEHRAGTCWGGNATVRLR